MRVALFLSTWIPLLAACATRGVEPVLVRSIALTGVEGRIDHLACDPATQRIFIAARNHGSLEVVDLERGERVKSIPGLKEPQGIVLVPARHEVLVASAGDGSLRAYDTRSLELTKQVQVGEDADNVRYDEAAQRVLVGHGAGALAILDATTLESKGKIALPAHPESFQLAQDGARVFANVPDAASGEDGMLLVAQRRSSELIARWSLPQAGRNYPLALLEGEGATARLFVGCRKPAKLLIVDARDGRVESALDCVGDVDDIFVDEQTGRVLVIGGEGAIDVFANEQGAGYARVGRVKTASGARTGLLVPELRRLFVAVSKGEGQACELREYRLVE